MKRILAIALISVSPTVFSQSASFIRNEISALETIVSKTESIFGVACKEATDGYNSCITRLAGFDYSMAIIRLPTLKKELASTMKAEQVYNAAIANTNEQKGCSNFFKVGQSTKLFVMDCMKVDGIAVRLPESKRSYHSKNGLTEVYAYGKTTFYFRDGILDYIIN